VQITVYESLVFSARLRHSRETEQDIIFAFVREVRCQRRPGPYRAQFFRGLVASVSAGHSPRSSHRRKCGLMVHQELSSHDLWHGLDGTKRRRCAPAQASMVTCRAFIAQVMELVELVPLANSIVGKPGISGLSVEQRKRLTIAVELVANPSIVFMDEPTSGLDARAAAIVMRTVRNTVNTGRTVVCTIHQPSIDIFEVCSLVVCCPDSVASSTRLQMPLCPDCVGLQSRAQTGI